MGVFVRAAIVGPPLIGPTVVSCSPLAAATCVAETGSRGLVANFDDAAWFGSAFGLVAPSNLLGKTYGRVLHVSFWGSNRNSSRNGFRTRLPGYTWSIYGAFFKPGPLVTVPGPTLAENRPKTETKI